MKQRIYYLLLSLFLTGCLWNGKDKVQARKSEQAIQPISNTLGLKSFKQYHIGDTINTDLNGDNIEDKAYFKTFGNNKILIIIDGMTKQEIIVGIDQSFGEMRNNFNWVEFWGVTDDKETYENIIVDGEMADGKKLKLVNPSIFVGKNEEGGGIITFMNGKFIWVHQAD